MRALFERAASRARSAPSNGRARAGARALAAVASALLAAACAGPSTASSAFALVSIQVSGVAPDLARVEKTLEGLNGVLGVQIDPREARVDVAYDPARATREDLLAAIQGLGYEAEAVFRRAAPVAPEEPAPEAAAPPGTTGAAMACSRPDRLTRAGSGSSSS